MKRSLLIIFSVLIIGSVASAQYKTNKKIYDYRTYSHQDGDPYSPALAAGISILLPGFGQIISGEFTRGFRFIGGLSASALFAVAGFMVAWSDESALGGGMMVFGALSFITIYTWAIFDAARVAKVNNLAYRDSGRTSMTLQISPYIGQSVSSNNSYSPGLSLRLNF